MDPAELAAALGTTARVAGLDGFGICTAEPFLTTRAELQDRVDTGRSGRLTFTFSDPVAATDVRSSFPWAERLVVGCRSYLPAAGGPGPAHPGSGRIARFAVTDFYPSLAAGLARLAAVLRQDGHRAEILIDDNRLVDRAAAVRAGIGWWGKNTMVLAPRFGPWLLLGSVVTDALLPVTAPMQRDCGTCSACLPACPTGALMAPGVLDARRCLAAWAQARGTIPREYREAMGDRLYGCDDCLDACPPGGRLLAGAQHRRGRVDLVEVLSWSDRTLLSEFGHFYLPRRQPRYLRRNALVALGNSGGSEAVALAAGYLGHPDPLLRSHAAWALGRLGGARAVGALRHRAGSETDPGVREELEWAQEAITGGRGPAPAGADAKP